MWRNRTTACPGTTARFFQTIVAIASLAALVSNLAWARVPTDGLVGYRPKWFIDYGYTVFGPTSTFVWHVNDFNRERIFIQSDHVDPVLTEWNQLTVVTDNIGRTVRFYLNGVNIGIVGRLPMRTRDRIKVPAAIQTTSR